MREMQPEELLDVIAANIKLRRRELGMTQGEVATAAGITQASLSRIEAKLQYPATDTVALLAIALRTTPSALLSPEIFAATA